VKLVEEPDVHLEIAFAMSHVAARDAEALLEEAARRADARPDAAGAALARGLAAQMRLWTGEGSIDDAERLGLAALPLLEKGQDHAGLAQMWFALAYGVYNHAGRCEQVVHAAEMARYYETLAGRPHGRSDGLRSTGLLFGPRPVGDVLRALDALDSTFRVELVRAVVLAMNDQLDDARVLVHAASERARELGLSAHPWVADIESLYGHHEAAAEQLRLGLDWYRNRGLSGSIGELLLWQARELALAGRYEEAEQRVEHAREHRDNSPLAVALGWQAAALVHSARGEHAHAERLAREAVRLAFEMDSPLWQGQAVCDLAEVLDAGGRREEAVAALQEALTLYERKQVIPLMRRVRERIAALEPA
jgi:tetratricopeptide (TPR) repeat protein